MFKLSDEVTRIDYIFSGLFHVSLLFAVYLNLELLIPKLFDKKKYIIYCVALVVTIVSSLVLNHITFNWLTDIGQADHLL
jgi:hypothetical protein